MCAFTLVACGSDSGPVGSAEEFVVMHPAENGSCLDGLKIDEPGDQKDLCDGAPADEICVKAGNTCFCAEASGGSPQFYESCYKFDLANGDVTRIGEGRDCKGISHTEYTCGEPPKCDTPCGDKGDCEKGEVCEEGCCVPEPPKCDTPCGDKGQCPKELTCVDACCVV
jgi:hypothetical protein